MKVQKHCFYRLLLFQLKNRYREPLGLIHSKIVDKPKMFFKIEFNPTKIPQFCLAIRPKYINL